MPGARDAIVTTNGRRLSGIFARSPTSPMRLPSVLLLALAVAACGDAEAPPTVDATAVATPDILPRSSTGTSSGSIAL